MNLRHLRHFITLAEAGSLHRAAYRLQLRQPALSHSIRTLEADVGAPLVNRSPSGTQLTRAGEIFLKEAQNIMSSLGRAVQMARQAGSSIDTPLRLGIMGDIVTTRLTDVLTRFQRLPSHGQASVSDVAEPHYQVMLDNDLLDLILLPAVISASYTVTAPLWWEDLHLVLPASHPLAAHSAISLDQLTNVPLILGPDDNISAPDRILTEACRKAGIEFPITATAQRLEVRLMLVAAGFGLTALPASSLIPTITTGIVSRPLQPSLRMMVAAAWSPPKPTPAVQGFLNLVRDMNITNPPP